MIDLEARLANAAAIEQYGRVMAAKGLHARARWAAEEARRLRRTVGVAADTMQARAA